MSKSFISAICLCASIGLAGGAAAAGDPAVYGAVPAVTEAQISPDGSTVAMLRATGDTMSVVFYDLADPDAKPAGVQIGGGKARDIVWADNDHVLVLASATGRMQVTTGLETIEFWRWFSVSKSKMKAVVLFGNEGNYYISSAGSLVSTLPEDDKHALIARVTVNTTKGGPSGSRLGGDTSGASYDLFKVNLTSGDTDRVAGGTENTYDWLVSPTGDPIARIDYDPLKKETNLFARQDGESAFRRVRAFADEPGSAGGIAFYGQSPDGSGFTATVRAENGRRSVVSVDKGSGDIRATLFSNAEYDLEGVIYDYDKAAATGVRYTDDLPRAAHFDPAEQKIQDQLAKALPGAAPMILSKSDDGRKLVVKAVYADHPEQYFLFDRAAKSLSMIAASYPPLDGKSVARKEAYHYASDDGLSIRGYLTVPNGAQKSKLPLIVLPHGGPAGRDDMAFDWWSFFYAANGYLVYQPNFRGSDGYGDAFLSAGFGEWGRKMQDDITDGVTKLVADGIADPERICIVGASYGGYAALAGATLTPDLYACAVSVNGVSDLLSLIGRAAKRSDLAEDYWDVRLGSRFRDADALHEVSPAKNADRAGPPIMLIHGRDDTVVPFSHSVKMHDALKAAGKPVELVELKGEDHWLSRSASRTATLSKSLEFINRHIGDR
ncbi:MAG: S9 family peptidase [Parvularculaceae bacterium]|nr:S9 family peptidase [Parvularculaceae bacterium]